MRYSHLQRIADAQAWTKKTYNNAISALRRAFAFGFKDHPEARDPAAMLRGARIGKKDRPHLDPFSVQDAEVLIAALRRDWGAAQANYDAFRFFTGLRPSEEIALVVSDYDRANGVLSITKARVDGIERDVTKNGEDRRVELCPRAIAILESHLTWRESLVRKGRIQHDALFFTHDYRSIPDIGYPYDRWRKTLQALPLRYRKPYTARHTSVSWNLMLGKNPLWVALQHGHRIATMLSVYAAWVEGARECDIAAIRRAMGYEGQHAPTTPTSTSTPGGNLLTGWSRESESLTIRLRLEASAWGAVVWPAKRDDSQELTTESPQETDRPGGQLLASTTAVQAAKSLKRLGKAGGADALRAV